jgi:glycosyltransferase involved in cell wall biosynthesis
MLGARGECYGQPLVPFFKRLTNKPVVFDAMITLYETDVVDRRIVYPDSFKAKLWHWLDFRALKDADMVLSDTNSHSNYYADEYGVDLKKFRRVFVGTDDEAFFPRPVDNSGDVFLVMFWGSFIPLHGIRYILKAAQLLENYPEIQFELRGRGQTYKEDTAFARSLGLKNVVFNDLWVTQEELPLYINRADVCLGVFGETPKAKRVIPTKAIDSMALKKPLITGDSLAAREIFEDYQNCRLVPMANPKAIADAILELKNDSKLKTEIAKNAYADFTSKLSPKVIGEQLKSDLLSLL